MKVEIYFVQDSEVIPGWCRYFTEIYLVLDLAQMSAWLEREARKIAA